VEAAVGLSNIRNEGLNQAVLQRQGQAKHLL